MSSSERSNGARQAQVRSQGSLSVRQRSARLSSVIRDKNAGQKISVLGLTSSEFDAIEQYVTPKISYRDLFFSQPHPPSPVAKWAEAGNLQLRRLRRIADEHGGRCQKILFGLSDGYSVESVVIRRRDGDTACISSQVGCAFSCRFCASGQAGLKRNLYAAEIVEQVVRLGPRVNRIVFMGIGEPLANYEQVVRAMRILRDRRGLGFPTTGISLSTVGIPKGLERLREEHLAIQLTISLHATTQEVRNQLIPGSKRHDLQEVIWRGLSWAERHNRLVTFAYLVLPGINDSPADASRLARLLAGQKARVNLMRYNPVDGIAISKTGDRSLALFRARLERADIPVVVRDTQGRDISAACGQLWLRDIGGLPLRGAM